MVRFSFEGALSGAAFVILAGCGGSNGPSVPMLTTQNVTFQDDDGGDDDDDDDTTPPPATSEPTTTGTGDTDNLTSGPTTDATTTTTTDDPTTAETTDDVTTNTCTPGTLGCPCDGGACEGELTCLDGACASPSCGDGNVDPGESCDEGDDNGPGQGCLGNCALNVCGDGDQGPGEACDNGNANGNTKACLASCQPAVCGDGFVHAGVEACDDGNTSQTDACTNSCEKATCGDGHVQPSNAEQCDDGNLNAGDGCSQACTLEASGSETISLSNQNKAINDGSYTGTQASMACVNLVAMKTFVVEDASLELAMDHTWIGDLTIKLYSPNNASVLTLMSVPGVLESTDDGSSSSSVDADLNKSWPILFSDTGDFNAESMGTTALGGVVCQDDGKCSYVPNKGSTQSLGNFAALSGTQAKGTWKLCIGDSVASDTGTIQGVTLKLNP